MIWFANWFIVTYHNFDGVQYEERRGYDIHHENSAADKDPRCEEKPKAFPP